MKIVSLFVFFALLGLGSAQVRQISPNLQTDPGKPQADDHDLSAAEVKALNLPVSGWCNPGDHRDVPMKDRTQQLINSYDKYKMMHPIVAVGTPAPVPNRDKDWQIVCSCHKAAAVPPNGPTAQCHDVLLVDGHNLAKEQEEAREKNAPPAVNEPAWVQCRQGGFVKHPGEDDSHCVPYVAPKAGTPGGTPWN